jgi:hypothetical protein
MAMYSFVSPFRQAKFCGVPSCVFDKSGCAAGEKKVAEHWNRVTNNNILLLTYLTDIKLTVTCFKMIAPL